MLQRHVNYYSGKRIHLGDNAEVVHVAAHDLELLPVLPEGVVLDPEPSRFLAVDLPTPTHRRARRPTQTKSVPPNQSPSPSATERSTRNRLTKSARESGAHVPRRRARSTATAREGRSSGSFRRTPPLLSSGGLRSPASATCTAGSVAHGLRTPNSELGCVCGGEIDAVNWTPSLRLVRTETRLHGTAAGEWRDRKSVV